MQRHTASYSVKHTTPNQKYRMEFEASDDTRHSCLFRVGGLYYPVIVLKTTHESPTFIMFVENPGKLTAWMTLKITCFERKII